MANVFDDALARVRQIGREAKVDTEVIESLFHPNAMLRLRYRFGWMLGRLQTKSSLVCGPQPVSSHFSVSVRRLWRMVPASTSDQVDHGGR